MLVEVPAFNAFNAFNAFGPRPVTGSSRK